MTVKKRRPSFEERLRRLQDIVTDLEDAELPLEQSVQLYKEGVLLSKACREELEKANHEIMILTKENLLEPFEFSDNAYIEDSE